MFRLKRNMPERMVSSPDPFESIIRGFGEIGALRRRVKLTGNEFLWLDWPSQCQTTFSSWCKLERTKA